MSYQTKSDMPKAVKNWHDVASKGDPKLLAGILSEDATFWSPVVHSPQEGRAKAVMYLSGAFHVLVPNGFHYVREVWDDNHAMLEFKAVIDGIEVNGIDMVSWNDADEITDFKVMVRPLQGMQKLREKMAEMLEQFQKSAR